MNIVLLSQIRLTVWALGRSFRSCKSAPFDGQSTKKNSKHLGNAGCFTVA